MTDSHVPPPQPFIIERDGARSLHFEERQMQSRMTALKPDALDLEYTRMMMGVLMFNGAPQRIGMIGLGGGSLVKFCWRYLAAAHIEVVEINPAVIAMREAFSIPPDGTRLRVLEGCGSDYVRESEFAPDALLVDGYDTAGVPAALSSQAFYDDCHACLADGGVMAVNLHVNHEQFAGCMERIRQSFGASVFEVMDDEMTNSVVFACKTDATDPPAFDGLRRPEGLAKEAWRQLMPTFRVMAATLTAR